MSKFSKVIPNISANSKLYNAQIDAYNAALSHYNEFGDNPKYRESLIVMPTGSGKSGVMAILPFGLSKKRVLIIAPGKIIRKTIFEHFDSVNTPEQTFWIKHDVIINPGDLPKSYLYKGFNYKIPEERELTLQKLQDADIVITNVHKIIGSSDEVNLRSLVPQDFFDLIIVDEAHHVAANMWKETIDYFKFAKVIKLTATPFRGDNQNISTHELDPIFEYTLAEAIDDKLLKNVVKEVEIPGKLEFYDTENEKTYTLQEAKEILGNDFVNRSVAMSEQCSKQVIEYTKETLLLKCNSYKNHQVLAVTCNDNHAKLVCDWFNESGLSATYVSTKSHTPNEIERRLTDFSNGVYKVMVSIQLLGEGYDNPNISLISIFRPFKTLAPYTQAIGRGLRRIRSTDTELLPIDNYCNVIYHQELGLEKLWQYYKSQEGYGEQLKKQKKEITLQLEFDFEELGFVEAQTSGKAPKEKLSEENYEDNIKVLSVNHYQSTGIGHADSFTENGFSHYKEEKDTLLNNIQSQYEQKLSNLESLVDSGIISESDIETLMQKFLKESQGQLNNTLSEFHENVVRERLKSDYISWLNSKVNAFFNKVSISKTGFELYESNKFAGLDKINNIGYIVKNINVSLFEKTKRHLSLYKETDFAYAKSFVLDKLDYFYGQYKKEDTDDAYYNG